MSAKNPDLGNDAKIARTFAFLFPTGGKRELARWIALLLMAWDHWVAMTAPFDIWGRIPGRVVFPIFGLFMGATLARGYPVGRYLNRLLPFALVAQVGFAVFSWPTFLGRPVLLYWNILFTLAFAALFYEGVRRQRIYAVVLGLAAAPFVDYGLPGITFVTASAFLAGCVNSPKETPFLPPRKVGCGVASLFFLGNLFALNFVSPEWPYLVLAFGGFLVLPLLWLVDRLPFGLPRGPWWLPYAYYPLHFVVLFFLRRLLYGG
ncbi:TraX family protein [Brockia lithotrophica]|uniref:TraX protein n=1 Tax=Brockia lithotrophica TaxID=933949 RepID=A0A660L6K8_9BACL|nr:TraX family protein [Brockia lithotrophica]RKQ88965.1 TraX protein [Brockia lithotrophica]